jgi:hypothetical protein
MLTHDQHKRLHSPHNLGAGLSARSYGESIRKIEENLVEKLDFAASTSSPFPAGARRKGSPAQLIIA